MKSYVDAVVGHLTGLAFGMGRCWTSRLLHPLRWDQVDDIGYENEISKEKLGTFTGSAVTDAAFRTPPSREFGDFAA